jgi:hypothetical protein
VTGTSAEKRVISIKKWSTMTKGRDDFDKPVMDALAKRAAYICSNPDCKALTIAPSTDDDTKFIYIGKAAHITAAAKRGPRFDPNISSEERKSINNGIFLCSNCADMIDKNKGIDFPVELLRKWKNDHESWVGKNLNKKVQEKIEPTQEFNVTSYNQKGGITAGIVNVGTQPRSLNIELQNQLHQFLPDKTKTVTVTCVMGDGEAFNFATEIKNYLINQGYRVNGVNQAIFLKPVIGQTFDAKKLTITVGTRQ